MYELIKRLVVLLMPLERRYAALMFGLTMAGVGAVSAFVTLTDVKDSLRPPLQPSESLL